MGVNAVDCIASAYILSAVHDAAVAEDAPRMNAVEIEVRRTIQREGAITFARYMEMALFSPAVAATTPHGRA